MTQYKHLRVISYDVNIFMKFFHPSIYIYHTALDSAGVAEAEEAHIYAKDLCTCVNRGTASGVPPVAAGRCSHRCMQVHKTAAITVCLMPKKQKRTEAVLWASQLLTEVYLKTFGDLTSPSD